VVQYATQQQAPMQQTMNPAISGLFKSINRKNYQNFLQRGSLIIFNYAMWKHDPYPLVLVTDFIYGQRLRGINLHYLTFPFIKDLLRLSYNNASFSYGNVKPMQYIVSAFRVYKWQGIKQIKVLDKDFLLTVMGTVRSFDPNQIKAIRESVQEQIKRAVNPKAQPTNEIRM
jgi:hypothetical protein